MRRDGRWCGIGLGLSVFQFSPWPESGACGFAPATAAESHQTLTIGESSGYVNSLFSTLALVGVIIAIVCKTRTETATRGTVRLGEELNRSTSARQKSEEAHAQQVRFLFLATYLNGLHQAIGCYDEMLRKAEPGCSQNHWLFKLTPLNRKWRRWSNVCGRSQLS